jgi:hypothetical protein
MKTLLFIFASAFVLNTNAQSENATKGMFAKKASFGFAVNNSWAKYRDAKDSAFYRPSLGIHAKADYFFREDIGITFGFGVQQRGMGIYTKDINRSNGDPDSTGRIRYKCTTVDFPIQFLYKPKKEIFSNGKMVFGLGIIPSYMFSAKRIFKSVDDGFHEPNVITKDFKKLDVPFRASVGLDIQTAGNTLFRVQLVGELGFAKIYSNPITKAKSYQNTLFGIDLTFMF